MIAPVIRDTISSFTGIIYYYLSQLTPNTPQKIHITSNLFLYGEVMHLST